MAITTKPHIIRTTTYERARHLVSGAMIPLRARQMVFVEGLASGGTTKAIEEAKAAALACDSASELENPSVEGMVVDRVTAELTEGGTSAWVTVLWVNPTLQFGEIVDQNLESAFKFGFISVPWVQLGRNIAGTSEVFSSDGRPNGTAWHGIEAQSNPHTDRDDAPTQYYRPVPVLSIAVPFRRASNPVALVAPFVGKCNADAVTWGGRLFPVRTLRCDAPTVDKRGDWFIGYYKFTARPDAWDQQDVNYTSGTWTTYLSPQCKSETFAGQFPAA